MGRPEAFTRLDLFRTVTSVLMTVVGVVIVVRSLPLGFHLVPILVGLAFVGLGVHRLAFVVAFLRRRGVL